MKTGIITTAVAALTLLGSALQSEARPHHKRGHPVQVHVSGYRSCGTPIYRQRYISHYQRCGTPYWRTRYIAPPRSHYYRAPVCPPPVRHCPPTYYHGGYPRSGVVIQGAFRL